MYSLFDCQSIGGALEGEKTVHLPSSNHDQQFDIGTREARKVQGSQEGVSTKSGRSEKVLGVDPFTVLLQCVLSLLATTRLVASKQALQLTEQVLEAEERVRARSIRLLLLGGHAVIT